MKKTTCTVLFSSPDSVPASLRAYLKEHKATEKDGVHTFQGASQKVRCDLSLESRKIDDLAIFLIFTNAYGTLNLYTFPDSLGKGRSHKRGNKNEALTEAALMAQKFQTRYDARKKSASRNSTATA